MKYTTLFTAGLVSSASAVRLVARENPQVVGLDIQRRHVADPTEHDQLRRRQSTVQQTLDNLETLYFANASLGTPPQNFRFHIDTGSSDLWANAANSRLCRTGGNRCGISGTYSSNDSSTYQYVNSVFNISYADGSGASGDYATDTFRFGSQTVQNLQFGIGYVSQSPEGILGIGYAINEVQVGLAGLDPYPNLPQKLVNDGTIKSNAYSLWLNDLDASTGSILFGGVDTEKYHGELQTLPILPEQGSIYAEFVIEMTGMALISPGGRNQSLFSNQNVPVLLDSGTSLTYLPNTVANAIFQEFNTQYESSLGAAQVDCNAANQQGSLDFNFSGVHISVPYNELVITSQIIRGRALCILGIAPLLNGVAILGDTFLRSAYVVYDLDNNEISLAQTNFNATKTSIQEIKKGAEGVPNASGAPNAPASSTGAAMPAITANAWLGGAAALGAGAFAGFNGF